jgi:predicted membrane channel-forming protein YqfA (hemolysin III family)
MQYLKGVMDETTESECLVLTTVVTNVAMLPAVISAARRGDWCTCLVGLSTIITSSLYHYCEAVNTRVWDMSAGQWHRLDNVFAICSMQMVCIFLMQNENRKVTEFLQWLSICTVCVAQEKAPWNALFTVVPVVAAVGIMLGKFAIYGLPKLRTGYLKCGILSLAVAVAGFAKGLDEDKDYMRMGHGVWHLAVGTMMYFMFQAGTPTADAAAAAAAAGSSAKKGA